MSSTLITPLVYALVIFIGISGVLGVKVKSLWEENITLKDRVEEVRGLATTCSDNTDKLAEQEHNLKVAIQAAVVKASTESKKNEAFASELMSTSASGTPEQVCAKARELAVGYLKKVRQ